MKVLIFNCGLLRLRSCCGNELFANPPFANDRFESLPKLLKESGADVVALQEIYEEVQVKRLLEAVQDVYPHHSRGDRRCCLQKAFQFHNGLMFLSKYPIVEETVIKHRKAACLENVLGSKCMLVTRIDAGDKGRFTLVNMHTTAGGGKDPEKVDAVRQDELQEAIDACQRAIPDGFRGIILGDLNMGPESSPANYEFMKTSGFVDAVAECAEDINSMCTWDPKNPLNQVGRHAKCPAQRCDHVFVHKDGNIKGKEVKMMFTDPMVEISKGKRKGEKSTLSDHYGLLIDLEMSKSRE